MPAPMLAALGLLGLLAGGVVVAAFPGLGAGGTLAEVSDPPAPSDPVTPTIAPTPDPTVVPTPTPEPVVTPVPTPEPVAGADLCEPIFGFPCGLGAGQYAPTRFEPATTFELGDGWSTELHQPERIQLVRDAGRLTLLGDMTRIYPKGSEEEAKGSLRRVIGRVASTDGTSASKVRGLTIDGFAGFSVDLTTEGGELLPILGMGAETVYLRPFATTRFVLLDVGRLVLAIVIEPADGASLEDILGDRGRRRRVARRALTADVVGRVPFSGHASHRARRADQAISAAASSPSMG